MIGSQPISSRQCLQSIADQLLRIVPKLTVKRRVLNCGPSLSYCFFCIAQRRKAGRNSQGTYLVPGIPCGFKSGELGIHGMKATDLATRRTYLNAMPVLKAQLGQHKRRPFELRQ